MLKFKIRCKQDNIAQQDNKDLIIKQLQDDFSKERKFLLNRIADTERKYENCKIMRREMEDNLEKEKLLLIQQQKLLLSKRDNDEENVIQPEPPDQKKNMKKMKNKKLQVDLMKMTSPSCNRAKTKDKKISKFFTLKEKDHSVRDNFCEDECDIDEKALHNKKQIDTFSFPPDNGVKKNSKLDSLTKDKVFSKFGIKKSGKLNISKRKLSFRSENKNIFDSNSDIKIEDPILTCDHLSKINNLNERKAINKYA